MNEFTKIILGNYEPLERKGEIFIYGIEERVNSSIDFIRNKYKHYDEFKIAIDYIEYFHSDTRMLCPKVDNNGYAVRYCYLNPDESGLCIPVERYRTLR